MSIVKCTLVSVSLLVAFGAAHAAPVNGTGNVTSDVIYGTGGNLNGSFTGETAGNIEVGLRAHLRYPPSNIFNYDGVSTYSFANGGNPANRSIFNFDWAVNVDQSGTGGAKLSNYDYRLSFDTDTTAAVAFTSIDPFNTAGYVDHSLGTNATVGNTGVEFASIGALQGAMSSYNIAQQSSNLGFGFSANPSASGIYDFRFEVLEKGTTNVLASSQIQVQVPVAPTLPLVLAALGLMGFVSRRKA